MWKFEYLVSNTWIHWLVHSKTTNTDNNKDRYSCGIKVIPRVSFTKVLVRIIWGAKYGISSYKQSFDVSPTSTCCNTHSSAFFGEGFFKCMYFGLVINTRTYLYFYFSVFCDFSRWRPKWKWINVSYKCVSIESKVVKRWKR